MKLTVRSRNDNLLKEFKRWNKPVPREGDWLEFDSCSYQITGVVWLFTHDKLSEVLIEVG